MLIGGQMLYRKRKPANSIKIFSCTQNMPFKFIEKKLIKKRFIGVIYHCTNPSS